ncbi:MAG: dephospho-CoA kinase [Rhodospirillales bacterium]
MVIIGLTGSIGMGKSTVAGMFRRMGIPVYDSDAAVHKLYARGGRAVRPIAAAFPEAVTDGAVDRRVLSRLVVGDRAAFKKLESIVHPLVGGVRDDFLRRMARSGAPIVVIDVPLLFEIGGDWACDAVVVVSAPPFVQRARVLARPGMTPAKLDEILARQVPDAQKRRRADYVVPTGQPRRRTLRALHDIVKVMRTRRGDHWPPDPLAFRMRRHARNRPRYRNDGARPGRRP